MLCCHVGTCFESNRNNVKAQRPVGTLEIPKTPFTKCPFIDKTVQLLEIVLNHQTSRKMPDTSGGTGSFKGSFRQKSIFIEKTALFSEYSWSSQHKETFLKSVGGGVIMGCNGALSSSATLSEKQCFAIKFLKKSKHWGIKTKTTKMIRECQECELAKIWMIAYS